MGTIHVASFNKVGLRPGVDALIGSAEAFVFPKAGPSTPVPRPKGFFYQVPAADLRRIENDGLVPDDGPVPTSDIGLGTSDYVCVRRGDRMPVTKAEIDSSDGAFSPLELKRQAVSINTMRKFEKAWAAKNFTTSVWNRGTTGTDGTTPSTKWDDGGDPIGTVVTQLVEPIEDYLEGTPGVDYKLVGYCGKRVARELQNHDQFRTLRSMTLDGPAPAPLDNVAKALNLSEIRVSRAVETTSLEGATEAVSNIVGDGFLVLVETDGPLNLGRPNALINLVYEPLAPMVKREPLTDERVQHVQAYASYAFHIVDSKLGGFLPNCLTAV